MLSCQDNRSNYLNFKYISYFLRKCNKGKLPKMDLPLMIYENTIFFKLYRAFINSSHMQSRLVTFLLELTQKSERVRFVSSPLLITRLVLFQIHLWDKRYFRLFGFPFYCRCLCHAKVLIRFFGRHFLGLPSY